MTKRMGNGLLQASIYNKGVRLGFGGLALVVSGGIPQNSWAAPDPTCVSYLTVGDSDCSPKPPKPVLAAPARENAPIQVQSEVDKYLADYGKPPREFVEFYLNPTAENASKWVQSYQQMLQKGQDLSKAWSDAEQLYGSSAQGGGATAAPALLEPQSFVKPVAPTPATQVAPQPVAQPALGRFGAFSDPALAAAQSVNGIRPKGVTLTYFFSQTCPYCARMTPDLAVLSKEMGSKLAFTCVDVTPVGPTAKPDESYITSKLPCSWRLPKEGEIEQVGVSQTPTLLIQKEGEQSVRLSGYVPLAQLRTHF